MSKSLKVVGLAFFSLAITSCGQTTTKVKVVDEAGQPLEKAEVRVRYVNFNDDQNKILKTDVNGQVEDSGSPDLRLHVYANKEGYYQSFSGPLDRKINNNLTMVLRKKANPIPLFAKKIKLIAPVVEQKLGYDFERADWVAPFGEGKSNDVFFEVKYDKKSSDNYDYELTVTFPNEFDGLREFRDSRLSELRSSHLAPEKKYVKVWKQEVYRRPNEGRSGNRDPLRNFWLRVRSKANNQGELISANYVKIYGDFPEFTYYFNPVPNDRNLEFDPEQNLFGSLPWKERVVDP